MPVDEEAPETTGPVDDGAASDDPYAPQPLDERGELTFSLSGNFEFVFPVHLANEMGEFDKENLDVEVVTIGATEQITDLAGGEADIAGIGAAAAALNAVDQGVELQFFQNTHDAPSEGTSEGLWVDKDKLTADGQLDPDQVDGLRIVLGTQKEASPTVFVLKTALDAVDKEVSDVEILGLNPNADSLVALQNGAADGAHLLSPFSDDPGLAECCALVQETIPAGKYAAMKEDLEGEPELYEAFVRALIRTQRTYLQGNYHEDPEVAPILADSPAPGRQPVTARPETTVDDPAPEVPDDPGLGVDAAGKPGGRTVVRRPTAEDVDPLKFRRRRRRIERGLGIGVPIVLVALWQVCSEAEWIDRRFFPPPTQIWDAGVELFRDGRLQHDLWVSGRRVLYGFFLGSFLGVAAAVLLQASRTARAALEPLTYGLWTVPKLALLPLLLLIFGIGETPIIILIVVNCFFLVFIPTLAAMTSVSPA